VQSISFGSDFNQPLHENVLPKSLRSITFGSFFNQPILENVLPPLLQSITFGYAFRHSLLGNVLPNSVEFVSFGYHHHNEFPICQETFQQLKHRFTSLSYPFARRKK
jgi:hypothetical protein